MIKMSKLSRLLLLGCATAALSACFTTTQTSQPFVSAFYSADVVRYVTAGRAMPLETVGQPFAGMDSDDVTWHTAQRMKLPAWFATRDFAPAPVRGTPSGNYRTVIVFNSADELAQLPGIGPTRAQSILEDRRRRGPYRRLEDLTRVRGIGPGTIARLRGHVILP